eukprot:TRINITY_DN8291_c0_g1_i1.p1 TRINITY_DN8291_c0_g1~~TRINITY_DN8291_c0_g1_i1.p1  ORF type:complete len:850 (+),score=229.02 TRINITY_DN8291_c0_g1_i1:181-2730(+)
MKKGGSFRRLSIADQSSQDFQTDRGHQIFRVDGAVKFNPSTSQKRLLTPVQLVLEKNGIVYSYSEDKTVRLWEIKTGKCVHSFVTESSVRFMEFHISYLFLVMDRSVLVWDTETGDYVPELQFRGHPSWITRFQIASGALLYTATADGSCWAWSLNTGQCLIEYKGHADSITSFDIFGTVLITGSVDKTVMAWEAVSINDLADLRRFDERQTRHPTTKFLGHVDWIFGVKVHQGLLYSASKDGTIRSWSIMSGECREVYAVESFMQQFRIDFRVMNGDEVFLFSMASFDVVAWNLKAGRPGVTFSGHRGEVKSMKLRDGQQLWTSCADRCIREWNTKDGTMLLELKHQAAPMGPLLILSDVLICGFDDGTIHLWDVFSPEGQKRRSPRLVESEIARLHSLGLSQQFTHSAAIQDLKQDLKLKPKLSMTDEDKKKLLRELNIKTNLFGRTKPSASGVLPQIVPGSMSNYIEFDAGDQSDDRLLSSSVPTALPSYSSPFGLTQSTSVGDMSSSEETVMLSPRSGVSVLSPRVLGRSVSAQLSASQRVVMRHSDTFLMTSNGPQPSSGVDLRLNRTGSGDFTALASRALRPTSSDPGSQRSSDGSPRNVRKDSLKDAVKDISSRTADVSPRKDPSPRLTLPSPLRKLGEKRKKTKETLKTLSYYFGELDRPDAEQILEAAGSDCFLLRNSSKPGCIALSKYAVKTKTHNHIIILIQKASTDTVRYALENSIDTRTYDSLEELITKTPELKGHKPVAMEPPTPPPSGAPAAGTEYQSLMHQNGWTTQEPAAVRLQDRPFEEKVSAISFIFPGVDADLVRMILRSVDDDADRCVDAISELEKTSQKPTMRPPNG